MKPSTALLAAAVLSPMLAIPAIAQANEVPGLDVQLAKMDKIQMMGREGAFPNGLNGLAMATTACNKGTVVVPWEMAMDPDHPLIAFLVAREADGRLEQISDYSYVKHGFFALSSSFCDPCQGGGGDVLGIGCSDTYTVQNNGDQFWLGPAEEIDPWLGQWDPVCSHFDKGEPPVAPPFDCDGSRSLTSSMASALNPVGHRINVLDEDLAVPGARFFYQGYYVVKGEPEGARENNLLSREFTPTWTGTSWSLPSLPGAIEGSILERWTGADLSSAKDGDDDGRVYVAAKVTGPEDGFYHYEYAIHVRDNSRGIGGFTVPICEGARVLDPGFRDPDRFAGNDWSIAVGPTSVTFSTPDNPVRWNSFYNFWFDSDAAPLSGDLVLAHHEPGPGADALSVQLGAPLGLFNVWLGEGCAFDEPPELFATGAPARATLGNPSFGLASAGNEPGQPVLLLLGLLDGSVDLGGGCTQWFGGALGAGAFLASIATADGSGLAAFPIPVPVDPALEGVHANFQTASLDSAGGPLAGIAELSNGLRVRVGNDVPGCP